MDGCKVDSCEVWDTWNAWSVVDVVAIGALQCAPIHWAINFFQRVKQQHISG